MYHHPTELWMHLVHMPDKALLCSRASFLYHDSKVFFSLSIKKKNKEVEESLIKHTRFSLKGAAGCGCHCKPAMVFQPATRSMQLRLGQGGHSSKKGIITGLISCFLYAGSAVGGNRHPGPWQPCWRCVRSSVFFLAVFSQPGLALAALEFRLQGCAVDFGLPCSRPRTAPTRLHGSEDLASAEPNVGN